MLGTQKDRRFSFLTWRQFRYIRSDRIGKATSAMAFGYEFVTLTELEKEQRRYLLGLYPTIAQWSALGVFVFCQLYFLLSWFAERSALERPKSPFGRPGKIKSQTWIRKLQQTFQRASWWAGKSVRRGWGTRGEWIAGSAWTVWLLFLSIHNTGNGMKFTFFVYHCRRSLGFSVPISTSRK